MGTLLAPRYAIRRISCNGHEAKLTTCGDGTFSVVIYKKGEPPKYYAELGETASRLLRDFTYTLSQEKSDATPV